MSDPAPLSVRISAGSPEADLSAAIWPGVSTIYYPLAESADQIRAADARIAQLERRRGIRPGTVEIRPMIESPLGVARAHEIGASSNRIRTLGVGPRLSATLGLDPGTDAESLLYARSECELIARSLRLDPLHIGYVLD